MTHGRRLNDRFRDIGLVMDVERSRADVSRVPEFFDLGLIEQVRRTVKRWDGGVALLVSTSQLLEAAAQRRVLPVHSLVNFGTGLNDRFRFGQSPMAIEMLDIPYSGPDPFSIMLCRDKHRTKAVVRSVQVQSPPGVLIREGTPRWIDALKESLFPVLAKPNDLGNSIGIESNIAVDRDSLTTLVDNLCRRFPDGVLVEKFIPGLEVTVLMLGNVMPRAYSLGLTSTTNTRLSEWYHRTFKTKSEDTALAEWCPLDDLVDAETCARVECAALACWRVLDCRDAARFDFRIDRSGEVWFIEANGQPDLYKSSGYVRYLNAHQFEGNGDGLLEEYLAGFFNRIEGFAPP